MLCSTICLITKKAYFIIEEPESHLFPNAQKLITEFISLAKTMVIKVLLTTHSPYILGTINNMLYANRISGKVDKMKLDRIIHPLKWIEFKKMSAYYVEEEISNLVLMKSSKRLIMMLLMGHRMR